MKKVSWIRTGLLLTMLIFAVLGGKFLYTVAENAAPLETVSASVPMTEGLVLTQSFSPEHRNVTRIALALQSPADGSDFSGELTLTLSEQESGRQLYRSTVSLVGVTDKWYLDFPVDCRLDTDSLYELSISVQGCDRNSCPALYLTGEEARTVEIAGSINGSDASVYTGQAAALRFTYDVLVPARAVLFFTVLAVILLCAAAAFAASRRSAVWDDITLGKFLEKTVCGIPLIHMLFFLAVTIAAVIIRLAFLPVKSNDYYIAYEVWINEIQGNGGLASLGRDIGDNPPLYMTLVTLASYLPFDPVVIVKLPSCVFDFILAVVSVKLLGQFGITEIRKKLSLYAVILLNPLTLLDSAAWGQCDALYSTFVLLTLLAICRSNPCCAVGNNNGRNGFMSTGDCICFLFAIAFSFKLQAIFFLPVICLVWIMQKRNVLKPVQLLWIPIVYTVSCIPMYLAGRDLKVMFKVYLGQANRNYGTLTLNYPNLYSLIGSWSTELYESYFIYGLLLAFLLLLLLFYQLYCRKITLDSLTLCKVTSLNILILCFFLPLVHERYAFVAEMLLFVIMVKEAHYIKVALITMLCTLFTYCTYLFQLEASFSVLPEWAIALLRLGIICYLVKDILNEHTATVKDGQ